MRHYRKRVSAIRLVSLLSLLTSSLVLPVHAWATDTDGDGVEDSADAFPNQAEATVDTDSDGQPDSIDATKLPLLTGFSVASPWSSSVSYPGGGSWAQTGAVAVAGLAYKSFAIAATTTLSVSVDVPPGGGSLTYTAWPYSGTQRTFTAYVVGANTGNFDKDITYTNVNQSLPEGRYTLQWKVTGLNSSGQYGHQLSALSVSNVHVRSALAIDTDDDNDGVLDVNDPFPLDPTETLDTDSDGIGNNTDTDDDGDTVADGSDNCPLQSNTGQLNTDGDPQGDVCDSDDDGDGVPDASDPFPLDPTETVDTDNDGTGNNTDPDDDNDGVADAVDNCGLVVNVDQLDTDSDWQGNACDSDDDGDGVADNTDLFPLDGTETVDFDSDGTGDNADADDDGDSTPDATDNCLWLANVDQLDTDNDAQGNACDSDDDNDGVADVSDKFPLNVAVSVDGDNDGFPSYWNNGCDTTCRAASGLMLDNCLYSANPDQLDTDNDGAGNACDNDDDNDGVADDSDGLPLDPAESVDTDNDGTGNNADTDDDNDGVVDATDKFPLNRAIAVDADNDGYANAWDDGCDTACQLSSGVTLDNCPLQANADQLNTDGDAQGNVCDSDDDNDGLADVSDNCPVDVNPSQQNDDLDGTGNPCDSNGPGKRDSSFAAISQDSLVQRVIVLPDNKLMVQGTFTTFSGVARPGIARLNSNGSLDTGFVPANALTATYAMDRQQDGKWLVSGYNSTTGTNQIARLQANGSLDTGFTSLAIGAGIVEVMAVQPDGRVVVGGSFTSIGGITRNRIARLNADGTLDNTFDPGAGITQSQRYISALALQPDGRVVAGGLFTIFNGVNRSGLVRLNADGSVDSSFVPSEAFSAVRAIELLLDGKMLVGANAQLLRLNQDGSIDTGFPGGGPVGGAVYDLQFQTDGKLVVAGTFTAMHGVTRQGIARLLDDGSLDRDFNPGTGCSGTCFSLDVQSSGKLLVAGPSAYNGATVGGLVRVYSGNADRDSVEDAADWFPLDPAEIADFDMDGIGNNADGDDDNDGVPDAVDASPINAANTSEVPMSKNGIYRGSVIRDGQGVE